MSLARTTAFRNARDAWWAARTKRPATAAAAKVAAVAVRKEQRWALSGKRYLRAYKGLDGGLIRWPRELAEMVGAQIEAIAPKLADAFDRRLGDLAFAAWRDWPVATGLSRSLLDVEFRQQGETFVGVVTSRAPYSTFIRRGAAVRDLLKRPGLAAAQAILADLEGGGDGR